jgi:hypothetical protein
MSTTFDMITDSGCTCHMMSLKETFISYKDCSHAYIILADDSKLHCPDFSTIQITLTNKSIILHDVLHVHSLWSPLLSVRCFHHLNGCSLIMQVASLLFQRSLPSRCFFRMCLFWVFYHIILQHSLESSSRFNLCS